MVGGAVVRTAEEVVAALGGEAAAMLDKIGDEFEMDTDTVVYVLGVSFGYKF